MTSKAQSKEFQQMTGLEEVDKGNIFRSTLDREHRLELALGQECPEPGNSPRMPMSAPCSPASLRVRLFHVAPQGEILVGEVAVAICLPVVEKGLRSSTRVEVEAVSMLPPERAASARSGALQRASINAASTNAYVIGRTADLVVQLLDPLADEPEVGATVTLTVRGPSGRPDDGVDYPPEGKEPSRP